MTTTATQRTPSTPKLAAHIRWMIRRDMAEVLAIEEACFDWYAWREDDFVRALRQRNVIAMVADKEERVVGFMVYELHKNRLHVLDFAVHPGCQRLGVGRQMIDKLKWKLTEQRRRSITLHVRETNLPAQLFFRAMGFRADSVVRDLYNDCDEDAYLFQYAK